MGFGTKYIVTMKVPIFNNVQYWSAEGESKMDFVSDESRAFLLDSEEQANAVLLKVKQRWGDKFYFEVVKKEQQNNEF